VQGVVHGASSSGQTVFVEPLETIEQNNELVRLLEEEMSEIHRILLEMTQRIGTQAEAILEAVDVLAELELQFAKAWFAEDYNCVAVTLSGGKSPARGEAAELRSAWTGEGARPHTNKTDCLFVRLTLRQHHGWQMQARAIRVILSSCNCEAVVPLWSHRSLRTVLSTKTHCAIWSAGRSNRALTF
jgi:hypothetical protein